MSLTRSKASRQTAVVQHAAIHSNQLGGFCAPMVACTAVHAGDECCTAAAGADACEQVKESRHLPSAPLSPHSVRWILQHGAQLCASIITAMGSIGMGLLEESCSAFSKAGTDISQAPGEHEHCHVARILPAAHKRLHTQAGDPPATLSHARAMQLPGFRTEKAAMQLFRVGGGRFCGRYRRVLLPAPIKGLQKPCSCTSTKPADRQAATQSCS